MGKGKDAAADHGRNTAICGGLTILCAFIMIIVAVVGISFNADPEIIKKCGATGYAADCSVLPTKSGSGGSSTSGSSTSGSSVTSGGRCSCCTGNFCTTSYQGTASSKAACTKYSECSTCDGSGGSGACIYSSGGRRLSFSSLIDVSQTKKLLESSGQGLVAHATNAHKRELNAHKRELKAFARLLAHHATTYDNSCATANNNICDDPSMKDYSEFLSDSKCKTGTDTNDCDGLVTGSPCKKGECCCSCKEGTETEATDKFSYKASGSSFCSDSRCNSNKPTTLTCDFNSFSSKSRYVDENWNVPAGDGCLKCCGLDKTATSAGESTIFTTAQTDELVGALRGMAAVGGVLAIVGVLPATVGGISKMMGNENCANILGGISMCTTILLGFLGTGIVTIYLGFLGALVGYYCEEAEKAFKANAEAIGAACDEACQAAMLHIKDEFCSFGNGLGATSAFLFICVVLGFISMIMTCIGFCQHKTPPPQQQPQIQVVVANPAANAAPVQGVVQAPVQGAVQPIQVQAEVAK